MQQTRLGKGKRVIGVFASLLGGGVLLESSALWIGVSLMLVGAALLVWGLVEMRDTEPRAED